MTDSERPRDEGPDPDSIDPGDPIAELAELREAPPPNFARRVMDGVDRRLLGGAALDLPWFGFSEVVLEYLTALFSFLGNDGEKGEDEEDWK